MAPESGQQDEVGSLIPWKIRAVSSVVEHYLDTVSEESRFTTDNAVIVVNLL
jgi:hypothetical protein